MYIPLLRVYSPFPILSHRSPCFPQSSPGGRTGSIFTSWESNWLEVRPDFWPVGLWQFARDRVAQSASLRAPVHRGRSSVAVVFDVKGVRAMSARELSSGHARAADPGARQVQGTAMCNRRMRECTHNCALCVSRLGASLLPPCEQRRRECGPATPRTPPTRSPGCSSSGPALCSGASPLLSSRVCEDTMLS